METKRTRWPGVLAWSLCALGFFLASLGLWLSAQVRRPAGFLDDLSFIVAFLIMAVVGALIASRHHRNAVGWIFLLIGVWATVGYVSFEYPYFSEVRYGRGLPGTAELFWVGQWAWTLIFAGPGTFLLLLFPDGRLPSRRWRPFAWLLGGFVSLATVAFATGWEGRRGYENFTHVGFMEPVAAFVEGPGFLFLLAFVLGCLASLVVRYRRGVRQERQQIKWFVFGAVLLALSLLVSVILESLGVGSVRLVYWIDTILTAGAFLFLPVSAGIGILKYRLFDIDVVINRTVVFAVLAALITALYVGIVVGVGALVGSRGNLFLSVVATALIALLFQPLRERARHLANRLVYGKRATPYEVLSEFGERLAGSYQTEDILPRLARIAGEGVGASSAVVWLHVGDRLRPAAVWPADADPPQPVDAPEGVGDLSGDGAFEVRHQGELLGAVSITMPPRESLTPTADKLLRDLAAQAGLIVRNVRLIEELRASRERLVKAQDEERRRLERNIHDGAQQQLVALAVRLNLARTIASKKAPEVAEQLDDIKREAQEALEDLRDLARGIYPPLLADKGLPAALEAQARKAAIPVTVNPNGVSRYRQEVEAGVYFCVLEALQNAAKYAEATRVTVRLSQDEGDLVFSVSDDGKGFDPATTPAGAGLQNMRDRLEALGGSVELASEPKKGTTVRGRIPVVP